MANGTKVVKMHLSGYMSRFSTVNSCPLYLHFRHKSQCHCPQISQRVHGCHDPRGRFTLFLDRSISEVTSVRHACTGPKFGSWYQNPTRPSPQCAYRGLWMLLAFPSLPISNRDLSMVPVDRLRPHLNALNSPTYSLPLFTQFTNGRYSSGLKFNYQSYPVLWLSLTRCRLSGTPVSRHKSQPALDFSGPDRRAR